MAEDIILLNAQGDAVTYENTSGIEVPTASGATATFIHDADIKQPDWNQTDSTKKDYIKNKPELAKVATEGTYAALKDRPFGDVAVVLEETELSFELAEDFPNYAANIPNPGEMLLGETYKVVWDGTEHHCVCTDGVIIEGGLEMKDTLSLGNKALFWGNGVGKDTGEPFYINWSEKENRLYLEANGTAETHTVSITPVNSVQKLDQKYLPDGLATEEFVKSEIAKVGGGGSSSGGVSSWNDLTDKPFGEETATIIFEGTFQDTLTDTDGDGVNDAWANELTIEDTSDAAMEAGQTYTVTWDGVEYECTAFPLEGVVALGNKVALEGEDTGEPFVLARDASGSVMGAPIWLAINVSPPTDLTISGAYTCKIVGNGIKHLDNKYLDFVVGGEDVIIAEQEMTFEAYSDTIYVGFLEGMVDTLNPGARYEVTWDGVKYTCVAVEFQGIGGVGNAGLLGGTASEEPFAMAVVPAGLLEGYTGQVLMIYTTDIATTTHTVGIREGGYTIKPDYLPEAEEAAPELPEVTADDNGKVLTVADGTWAAAAPAKGVPEVTEADDGKFLRVVGGAWAAVILENAEEASF